MDNENNIKNKVINDSLLKIKNVKNKILSFFSEVFSKVKNKVLILLKKDKEENIDVEVKDGVSSDTFVKDNLTEEDKAATKAARDLIEEKQQKKKKLIRNILIAIASIVVIIIIITAIINRNKKNEETEEIMKQVQTARVMNISQELSGSGTLKPKDSYTITSLVEGEVTGVFFEEGDIVEKGQLLITIDSETAYRTINTASSSLAQAKDNYNQALYEYEKKEKDYEGNTYKAPYTGYLRTLSVKKGDTLNSNTQIATIVDDSVMTVKVPFVVTEARQIRKGMSATLFIVETMEPIPATVESVAKETRSINGGQLVSYVTLNCKNPGGLTTDNSAMAVVADMTSTGDGNFELKTNETITFNDGNDVDVEEVLVSEGAYVEKGTPIFKITEETIMNVLSSKKSSYLSAKDSLTRAESNYEDALDTYNEYYITAPIEGTVISKNAKVGDKIQRNTSSVSTLAIIYDLSELTVSMDVDELDISNVKVGQSVNIQADAFNNKVFNGTITNISLVSSNSNGVTNYPVTITITDIGSLLPGMNVDAYVILESAENAICIPADALQRGNVVYVLNSSETIKNNNYSTEGISDRVKNNAPDGFTAINVTTGVSNENYIQIVSGLVEGDQVYVSESSSNSFNFGGFGGPMGGGPMGGGGGQRR